jgi:hypothetical protein
MLSRKYLFDEMFVETKLLSFYLNGKGGQGKALSFQLIGCNERMQIRPFCANMLDKRVK